eukprot:14669458-Ditylum_brightwellii.AAC.1
MPEVNEVIYDKHKEHGRLHCACILLSINHNMEFLVVWFEHPTGGEQVIPHHWVQMTGLVVHHSE